MDAYLLTWNPNAFGWGDFSEELEIFCEQGYLEGRWSTGNTKRIKKGNRLFMLRQGEEPRGIIGSGYATSKGFTDKHWDDKSKTANYVKFRLDILVDYENTKGILSRGTLLKQLPMVHWDTPASGMSVPPKSLPILERLWSTINPQQKKSTVEQEDEFLSEEVVSNASYPEGASRIVQINAYERNTEARRLCIKKWGTRCHVCSFSFPEKYGPLGEQFIHVHHLVPLSSIKKRYHLDPISDLRPVCPNCHAMIHRRSSEPLSIAELKAIISSTAKRRLSRSSLPTIHPR